MTYLLGIKGNSIQPYERAFTQRYFGLLGNVIFNLEMLFFYGSTSEEYIYTESYLNTACAILYGTNRLVYDLRNCVLIVLGIYIFYPLIIWGTKTCFDIYCYFRHIFWLIYFMLTVPSRAKINRMVLYYRTIRLSKALRFSPDIKEHILTR